MMITSSPTRAVASVVLLALVFFSVLPAQAQVSWVVADRDAAQITSLVSKLEPYVDKLPGQKDADAVILFNQLLTRVEGKKAEMCRNMLLEVREPDALVAELTSPWVEPGIEVSHLAAFVLRKGEVRAILEESLTIVEGAEGYGRGRCEIDWGETKKGDVLGWSWVGELDQNLPALSFPVANVYPSVISSLTLDGGGDFVYAFEPVGFPAKDMSLKEREMKEGEPSLWKASVNAQAAIESLPLGEPYPSSVPHIAVSLKKVWIEPQGGPVQPQWMGFGGWNQTAQLLQVVVTQAEKDSGNLDIMLSAVTTGASTEQEKIDAVFRHVQQKLSLLEGPEVRPLGYREDRGLMKAKAVTPAEKVIIMAVLLRKLEISASLAMVHTTALGEFDEERQDWLQFDQLAVRTGDMENGKFYVPQCADCEPGALPPDWIGGTALVAPSDVDELAKEFAEDQRKKAILAGAFNMTAMRRERDEQPWHKLVKLGE